MAQPRRGLKVSIRWIHAIPYEAVRDMVPSVRRFVGGRSCEPGIERVVRKPKNLMLVHAATVAFFNGKVHSAQEQTAIRR